MSHRKSQIESTLRRAISKAITQQLSDPRVVGMVTITRVDVSPDLHEAYVYVSVLPEKFQRKTVAGLIHAAGHVRSLVRKQVRMRHVPRFDFRLDETLKKEAAIFQAIEESSSSMAERQNDV